MTAVLVPATPVALAVRVRLPAVTKVTENAELVPLVTDTEAGNVAPASEDDIVAVPVYEVALLKLSAVVIVMPVTAVPAVALAGTPTKTNLVVAPAATVTAELVPLG